MKKYSLYYYDTCGYCMRVLRTIERLKLDVEKRHIRQVPQHLNDLLTATGRKTVPVLRIDEGGDSKWLPESTHIIAHLESLT